MKRALLALALLGSSAAAWADSAAIKIPPLLTAPGQLKYVKTDLAGCVKNAQCWGFIRLAFSRNFPIQRERVDAALPGQFFPNTTTFSLRAAEKGTGHFLYILCGEDMTKRHKACNDVRRDQLERRVFESAVVLSFPGYTPDQLVDPDTMALTATAKQALKVMDEARPQGRQELLSMAVASMGVEPDPVPKALR